MAARDEALAARLRTEQDAVLGSVEAALAAVQVARDPR